MFWSRPGQPELRLAEADQPAIASDGTGAYRLWTADGRIMLLSPGGKKARPLGEGSHAAAAGSPDGRGPVIAVWQSPGDAGGVSLRQLSGRR